MFRVHQGMPQIKLSKQLEVDVFTIRQIENGKTIISKKLWNRLKLIGINEPD